MRPGQLMPSSRESEVSPIPRPQDHGKGNGEARPRAQLALDPVAIYTCNASGVIDYFNERAAELWGRRPAIGDTNERFCGAHMLFRPDGSHMPHEQYPMADVVSGKISGVQDAEVHIERPDGSRVEVIVNIVPLIKDRQIVGAANSFYDVADKSYVEGMRETTARKTTIATS
jgi:PAS domain-containing protein